MVAVKVFQGHFQRCHTKGRSRQTPQTPACTRLLWTASVDFAKRTALRAGTLNLLVWDPHYSKVRVAGCKRHSLDRNLFRVHGTTQTILGYIQQIRLRHKNTASCLHLQSNQQHCRGSHVCGVNMEDDTQFSSLSRRLPHRPSTRKRSSHRRARANLWFGISPFSL